MKITLFVIIAVLLTLAPVYAKQKAKVAPEAAEKLITGLDVDLNKDGKKDLAMLVDTKGERKLIVMMKEGNGYKNYVLNKDCKGMELTLVQGDEVAETVAGPGHKKVGKKYKTNGVYLQLAQPEASSVVYFWTGKEFKEVWTSD